MPSSNTSTVTYYSPLQFIGTVTAGTINATSVVTSGVTTYNNLTANSAVATDGSKNLVSVTNTGSGNNVLANTPTLITPILGVASGTSLSLSSTASATVYTSTITTGTAPLVVASTTNVANLNASLLNGSTFASPSPIGSTTANTGAFTTLSTSGLLTAGAGLTSTAATNNFGATTLSGAIAMGTNKITGLGYPTANTDAASKLYVDTVSQGLDAKDSVRAATTVNGTLATAYENGDTIDGVTLATGNRILLKNQTDPIENGIYVVAASGAPTRATDFAAASTPTGAYTFVEEGTVNISAGFVSTAPAGTNTVGTHAMPFTQFSGAGQIIAGTGLTKTGNTLSVNASQTQITSVGTLTALTVSPGAATLVSGSFSTTLDVTGITSLHNTLEIYGATTGIISVKAQAAAGTFNFNLPTTAGSSSDVLTSAGGAGAPMTWSASNGTGDIVRTTSATLVTPVLGAATGTSLQLSGLTASQAVATDASKNLVSVATTGTGNYVLQTSPTLITPTLGAAVGTSLQLSGLTASQAVATDASKNLVSVATTGTGNYVLANTPTLITPVLGAATGTSLNLSGLTASQVVVTDGSKNLASLGYSATPTASFIVSYDANKNITANNLIGQSTTTATAAGTTILTVASTLNQIFTGTTTQTIQLPDGTTVPVGWQVNIINRSTQDLSVVDAGSNAVVTVYAGKSQQLILSVSSTNGTWALLGAGSVTSVAATVPAFLSIAGSPITSSGTLAITLSGTALPITSGGTGSTTATGTGSVVLANTPTLITPVLGAATGTSLNLSGLTASQAVATDASKNLVSVATTGTGNYVLSASPTLTGTIIAASATLSGVLTSSNTTASTSNATGSVLLAGGLGISNATDATSSTNGGSITTAGGLAVAKKAYFGDNALVGGGIYVSGAMSPTTLEGVYIGGNSIQLNAADTNGLTTIDFSFANQDFLGRILYNNNGDYFDFYTNEVNRMQILTTGVIIHPTTVSTNTTSGALIVSGGVGIAGALFGTTMSASGLITANLGLTVTGANTSVTTLGTSGLLTAGAGITSTAATNNFGATTMSGAIAMGTNKITGLGYPTASTDAASKLYVDTVAQGLDAKYSVVATTTVNGTLATAYENGDIIDGVTLATGNRILIKDQTTATENGIYVVNVSGAPTRATDFATGATVAGAFVFIEQGTLYADTGFVCTSNTGTDIVDTDSLAFVQFSSAGQITAGTGLTKTGNTLSVNASQTQITTVGTLTALTVTGLITGNLGLTVTGANTSVTTLSASGLITANLGLTVTGATTSVTSLTASSTVSATQYTSTISTGTAPLVVASTTNVANLNASSLSGATFASPGPIGSTTASTGAFSTLTTSGASTLGASNSLVTVNGGIKVTSDGGLPLNPTDPGAFLYYDSNGFATMQLNGSGAATGGSLLDFSSSGVDTKGRILYTNSDNILAFYTDGAHRLSISGTTNFFALTTASTTTGTGAITTAGGFATTNTTDAVSSTNGGTFTSAGGLAVAKKVFIGTALTVGTTVTVTGLTASQAVATDASKNLVSVATTGTGNYVLAASPTLTGTLTAAAITASALVTANLGLTVTGANTSVTTLSASDLITANAGLTVATGTTTLSTLTASTALALDGSKGIVSVTNTGTGNNVLSASPTLTGTIIAAAATLSGVLTSSNTTASTSNSTGSLLLSGGIGISNTTDATSSTNGGSLTTAGGLAVAKKAYFGDNVTVNQGMYISGVIPATTQEGVYIGSNSIQLNSADNTGATLIDFSYANTDLRGRILYNNNGDYFDIATAENNRIQVNNSGLRIFTTTVSTNTTSGALIVSGGVGIAGALFGTTMSASGLVSANLGLTVTSANTSVTTLSASGLVTTNAGIALTGDLTMAGSSSGIVSIKTQAAAGTFNFNLPVTAGSTGQVLASAGGASSPMTWKTVLSSSQSTFGGAQSATNSSITGLVFTSGSFETNVIVDVVATTNLTQVFKLSGVLSGGASNWNLTAVGISGEATGVTFTITSGGQIQYSSTAYAGFVSLTFTWTDYINASGLLNLTSGVNVSKVISGTDGPLFNVSGATVTDSGTANSGTLALFSANYIGRPTIAATGTSVTTTQANTVFIAGEPIAGTNETITNKHALKIGAGGKIGMDGSTSGTVSITTQAAAGTFNFNLPVTAGSSGQVLASAGGSSTAMTWKNVTTAAIAAGSFAGANNQSSPANITGLVFSSGYFKIDLIVTVVATTNLTEYLVVYGVLSNNIGTGWTLTSPKVAGDTTGAAITINSSGQLLYTSANHSGFTSITFAWA